MVLNSLSDVFLKVEENRLPLEFWFSQSNVDFFALLYFSPKNLKMAESALFVKKIKILRALLHNELLKFVM